MRTTKVPLASHPGSGPRFFGVFMGSLPLCKRGDIPNQSPSYPPATYDRINARLALRTRAKQCFLIESFTSLLNCVPDSICEADWYPFCADQIFWTHAISPFTVLYSAGTSKQCRSTCLSSFITGIQGIQPLCGGKKTRTLSLSSFKLAPSHNHSYEVPKDSCISAGIRSIT
jgi:hypothetical protein